MKPNRPKHLIEVGFYAMTIMTMVHTSLCTLVGIKTWINSNYRSVLCHFHFMIVYYQMLKHHDFAIFLLSSPCLPNFPHNLLQEWSCPKFHQVVSKFHSKINSLTDQTTESWTDFSDFFQNSPISVATKIFTVFNPKTLLSYAFILLFVYCNRVNSSLRPGF